MDTVLPPSLLYLWDRRTFYLDILSEPLQLTSAAAMLVVSLGQPITVQVKGVRNDVVCHSILVAAGQHVCADTGKAMIAICFLDPFGEDYAALAPTMEEARHGMSLRLRNERCFQQAFESMSKTTPTPNAAYAVLDKLLCPQDMTCYQVDPRVVQVVALIKASVAENLSVEELAKQVNLSVPRLVQLFKQYVGVPIRRYRQWHRLYVTAVGVARGESLTQAAIAAGFNDSAHFSKTFRTMVGIKPSTVLSRLDRVCVFAPARPELDASLTCRQLR